MLAPGFRVLEERERLILHLRFFEGLTQSQIAQQVGISQMHVSRLIRRSLEKMRREIAYRRKSGSRCAPAMTTCGGCSRPQAAAGICRSANRRLLRATHFRDGV